MRYSWNKFILMFKICCLRLFFLDLICLSFVVFCFKFFVSEFFFVLRVFIFDVIFVKDGLCCLFIVVNVFIWFGMVDLWGNGGEMIWGGECLGWLWIDEVEFCLLEFLLWEVCMEIGGVFCL